MGETGSIPDRWLYCPKSAISLLAEKFLALKTPLSDRFTSQMPMECQFLPKMAFSFAKMFKAKIGLWIDLTTNVEFYDSREVEENDCQYMKLQCRDHGEAPSHDQTKIFVQLVDQFVTENPLDIVAVHCTHGFNRTGFLIVSYMVQRLNYSVEAAVLAFAQARPPGIYKDDYIKELFRRNGVVGDALAAPEKPIWCTKEGSYKPDNHATQDTHQEIIVRAVMECLQRNGFVETENTENRHEFVRNDENFLLDWFHHKRSDNVFVTLMSLSSKSMCRSSFHTSLATQLAEREKIMKQIETELISVVTSTSSTTVEEPPAKRRTEQSISPASLVSTEQNDQETQTSLPSPASSDSSSLRTPSSVANMYNERRRHLSWSTTDGSDWEHQKSSSDRSDPSH